MSKTLFFTNPISCSGCRIMDKVLEENDIEVTVVDITTPEGCVTATKYRIMGGLPAFIKIDDNDNVIDSHNGTMSVDRLKGFVNG